MMHIEIIAIGKIKDTYWRDAIDEYMKRLRPYAKIRITELPEEPFRSAKEKDAVTEREAEKIQKHIGDNAIVIALDEQGKQFSSVEFAGFIEKQSAHGETLVFVIGGPLGLHPSITKRSQTTLSLSTLTFTHPMARVIIMEQLYRSVTILQGKVYHY